MAKRKKPITLAPVAASIETFDEILARSGIPYRRWTGAFGSEHLLEKNTLQRYFYLIVKSDSVKSLGSGDLKSFSELE